MDKTIVVVESSSLAGILNTCKKTIYQDAGLAVGSTANHLRELHAIRSRGNEISEERGHPTFFAYLWGVHSLCTFFLHGGRISAFWLFSCQPNIYDLFDAMLNLYDELRALIASFDSNGIDYALCGGLAMAVYGHTRATVDIDILIPEECLEAARSAVRELGYTIAAAPMSFAGGTIEIRRISKPDPEAADLLMLDLLLVTAPLAGTWQTRQETEWENGSLWVVSREGLIALKRLRGSSQDLNDIARLKDDSHET